MRIEKDVNLLGVDIAGKAGAGMFNVGNEVILGLQVWWMSHDGQMFTDLVISLWMQDWIAVYMETKGFRRIPEQHLYNFYDAHHDYRNTGRAITPHGVH